MSQLNPDIEVAHYSLTQKVEEGEEGPVRCTLCYEVFKIPKQGPGIPLQDPVLIRKLPFAAAVPRGVAVATTHMAFLLVNLGFQCIILCKTPAFTNCFVVQLWQ